MFWQSKKARSHAADEAATDSLRRELLKARLLATLQSTTQFLIDEHHLEGEATDNLCRAVDHIRTGIDLVLVAGLDAYSKDIPDFYQGGAIMAQSADAFSQAAAAIGDTKREQAIGSIGDPRTTGHIFHQLGFGS